MNHSWPKATAARLGIGGAVDYTPARVGLTLHVPCEKGQHVVDFKVKRGLNPEGVAKRMLEAGWTIGRRPVCPSCNTKKKEDKMAEKSNVEPRCYRWAPRLPLGRDQSSRRRRRDVSK